MLDDNKYSEYFPKKALDAKIIYQKLEKSGSIKKFRDGWNLPPNGCSNYTNFQKWYEEFVGKITNNFFQSSSFKKMQEVMKQKKLLWANGEIPMSDIDNYDFEVSLRNPVYKFDYDIDSIMTELAIPAYYKAFVHDALVLSGQPKNFPLDKDLPKFELSIDLNTGRKRLFIEVFADTNIDDFDRGYNGKLFKSKLEENQQKLYDYKALGQIGPDNLDMWSKIYDWHYNDKKSYKEIKVLALKEFSKKFSTLEDIGTGLNRYKKLIGIGTTKTRK